MPPLRLRRSPARHVFIGVTETFFARDACSRGGQILWTLALARQKRQLLG